MPTPLEILNFTSNQNQKSVELFSNLISRSYEAASNGIRQASAINTQMVNSALDYKKTQIDEWYKGEELKRQSQQLDLQAQSLAVDSWYKENVIKDAQDRMKQELELKQDAQKNRLAYGVVNNQLGIERTIGTQLQSQVTESGNRIQGYNKELDALYNQFGFFGGDRTSERIKELTEKLIPEAQKRYDEGYVSLQERTNRILHLQDVGDGLRYGTMDPDTALDSLKSTNFTTPKPEEVKDKLPTEEKKPVAPPSTPEELSKGLSIEQIQSTQSRMIKSPTGMQMVIQQMPKVYNELANPEAKKQMFQAQQDAMKGYANSLFTPLITGKEISAGFEKDNEENRQQFLLNGGSQREWNNITYEVRDKFGEFRNVDDKDRVLKVNQWLQERFNPKPDTSRNTGANTGALIIDFSGVVNKNITTDEKGRIKITNASMIPPPEEDYKGSDEYKDLQTAKESRSKYDAADKKVTEILKDQSLKKANYALTGLKPEAFGITAEPDEFATSTNEFTSTGFNDRQQVSKKSKQSALDKRNQKIKELINNADVSTIYDILMRQELGKSYGGRRTVN